MAKSRVSGDRGLNFTARLDINEAKKNALELQKIYKDLNITTNSAQSAAFKNSQLAFQEELRKSRLELAALKKEEQEFRNARVKTGSETAELTKKLVENRLEQQKLTKEAREARKAAQDVAGSYNEAQKRLKELGIQIKSTSIGMAGMSPTLRAQIKEYNDLNDRLKAFDAQMGNFQRNVGNYQKAYEGLSRFLTGFVTGSALLAGAKQILDTNAQISDSLADVRRTAGLTAAEAENLAEQLKKIDTRTSLKGLLEISAIGGQLGIAKDQLAGFTKAIDQLAVALSGELDGGAEGIAKSLGVLDNIFKVTQSNGGDVEKSLNQIGSAILGLGQSGLATGDYLADFSERVGGIAKQAGLSLPVILSYGAVLQENGVSAEVAGSSFKRLLSALTTNREKFLAVAKIADANLTLKDFTNIINTDAKKALDLFFAGLAKGGTTTTSFNDILKSLKLTQGGVSQTIAALSAGQAELNGHIQDSTRDFTEATLAAEQAKLKNENLAASLEKLSNSFSNETTKGNIASFFKYIVDSATGAVKAIGSLFNSGSIKTFLARAIGGGTGVNAILANVDDEAKRFGSLTVVERALENFRLLNDEKKKQAIIDRTNLRDKAYEQAIQLGATQTTIKNYNNEQKVLTALRREYNGLKKDKKAAGVQTETNIPEDDKKKTAEARKLETALNAQRTLQAEIDSLTKKGRAKQKSDDDQDLLDIELKYKKLTDKAIAFNNSIKNKGLKVNLSGLQVAESEEKSAKSDENKAKSLKKELEVQKALYADFEQYKSDFGIEKAKAKYAKLIDVDSTYLQNLKNREYNLNGDPKAKGGNDGPGEYAVEQLKVITEASDQAVKEEQKKTDALLKEFMSYADKRKNLTETYQRDIQAMENNPGAIEEREKRYTADLKQLDDANAKKIDSYRDLFTGIENLSKKSAMKLLESARVDLAKQIKAGKIVDPKQIAEINQYFNEVENTIRNGSGQALIDLARQVDGVASEVGKLDEEFGKVLSTLGNVLGQVGNIKSSMASLKIAQGKGDVFGQLSSGLGIFAAGMSIFQGIVGLFDKSAQREEQAAYSRDLQNKQTEALNKALERQIALLNDVYGTERISNYSEAIKQAQDNQAKYASQLTSKYSLSGNKQLDDVLTKINNGEGTGVFGLSVDAFVKANQAALDKLKLPSDINSLQRLLDEGKLDANTSTIVTNLLKAKQTAEELVNSLRQEVVGTSLAEVADDFIKTLTDGTQDFGKTFEETIQKSLLNGFKGELIRKQLQAFYTQFAELSQGGLTKDEIDTLRISYLAASTKAKADLDALSKATGIDLTGAGNSSNSLKGAYSAASQESITLLAGQTGGMRLAQLQTNLLLAPIGKSLGDLYLTALDSFAIQVKIEANTLRTANNTDRLANIEAGILAMAKGSNGYSPLQSAGGIKP